MADSDRVITVIIALNVLVFIGWNTADRASLGWMQDHFTVSWAGMLEGRAWTLLTSEFSQYSATHLLFNMLALYVFGRPVGHLLGARGLLHLYLAGAIVASLGHVLFGLFTGSPTPALGASGAVMALGVVFAALFPRVKLLIMGIIPVPAAVALGLYILFDLFGLASSAGGVAHAAHLGGAAYGLLYWWRTIRKTPIERRARMMSR